MARRQPKNQPKNPPPFPSPERPWPGDRDFAQMKRGDIAEYQKFRT